MASNSPITKGSKPHTVPLTPLGLDTTRAVELDSQNDKGQSKLDPLENTIPSDEDDALSQISKDSFDWIGDDRHDNESELEEETLIEEFAYPPSSPETFPSGGIKSLFSVNFLHHLLGFVFLSCSGVFIAKILHFPMPIIFRVSLETWTMMIFLITFIPVWINTGLIKLVRFLRSTSTFSKTEHPTRLEAIKSSLTLMLSSVTIGIIWMYNFPQTCPPSTILDGNSNVEATVVAVVEPICYYSYASRAFFFSFVIGLVTALDTLLMTFIRSSFQESSFKTRIIDSRFKVHIVDQLLLAAKHAQLTREASGTLGGAGSGDTPKVAVYEFMFNLPFIIPQQIIKRWNRYRRSYTLIDHHQLNTPTEQQVDNSGFAEFKEELTQTLYASGYENVANAPPRTDYKAKVMARMIFHYLCPSDRKHLIIEDFNSIIHSEAAAREAYALFDYDRDGTITKGEFRNAVVKIFREQRNLAQSVANTGSVLAILDTISLIVVGAGLFLLLLALLGAKVQSILGVAASVVLGMNFIIYDAANKTFHAVLFLFVVHPYDVGDRVVIGNDIGPGEEEVLTVSQINIQNTIFRRWNGLPVSIPNHSLAANPLTNLSRATEQWERIEFTLYAPDKHRLGVEEETSRLADFRHRVETFLSKYSASYYQNFELRALVAADAALADRNLDTIRFILKVRCRETVDNQKKWVRHARLLAFVKGAVTQAGVEFVSAATAA